MNLTNLKRDGFWMPSDWSSERTANNLLASLPTACTVDASEPIEDVAAAGHVINHAFGSSGGLASWGVKMIAPQIETNPYRVKAYCTQNDTLTEIPFFFVGYNPDSGNGVLDPIIFPMHEGIFDDVLMIPYVESGANAGRALCFGIVAQAASTAAMNAVLSVQRLVVASPPFGTSEA